MISFKIDPVGKGFTATVRDGDESREYAGRLSICTEPSCGCTTVGVELYLFKRETNKADWSKPDIVFRVNLDKRVLDTSVQQLDGRTKSFARRIVSSLSSENWGQLWDIFVAQKVELSEAEGVDGASLIFPVEAIEDGGMVGYHEILPFGSGFQLTKNDVRIIMEDSYCLKPGCSCADAELALMVVFRGLFKKPKLQRGIFVNYKTKKWDLSQAEGTIPLEKDAIPAAVERELPDIYMLLKDRHRKLKAFYKRFREAKNLETIGAHREPAFAISRNSPCPCGSGKKYKRYCGRERPQPRASPAGRTSATAGGNGT